MFPSQEVFNLISIFFNDFSTNQLHNILLHATFLTELTQIRSQKKAETIGCNFILHFQESIESVLDNLIHIVAVDSFNLLLVTSAASSSPAKNKLKSFIKTLVKVNQASQESQGESVKNSLLRSALFDVTFLMIVHIVQCFGIDIVLAAIQQNPSDATLSTGSNLGKPNFLQSWLTEMWMGRGTSNTRSVDPLSKGKVDNLLQVQGRSSFSNVYYNSLFLRQWRVMDFRSL